MAANAKPIAPPLSASAALSKQMRGVLMTGTVTLFAALLAIAYLMPLGYAAAVSLRGTSVEADAPLWPAEPAQYTIDGQSYDIYRVPIDGQVRRLAIVKKGRERSTFVDPADPGS